MKIFAHPQKLLIATHNPKKRLEMEMILKDKFQHLELLTLNDFPDYPEPEEIGKSMEENAILKAEAAAAVTGFWAIADDGGLEIDLFYGRPGLYSKRFAGEETPFPVKMRVILELMEEVPLQKRGAQFRSVIALAMPDEKTEVFEGICRGRIHDEPRGTYGFGYDPILFLPELGKTMAELKPGEKNLMSHRRKCLDLLSEFLSKGSV